MGVSIYNRAGRLYLKATLPPKPGSQVREWHQQRIALGVSDTTAGLRYAEAKRCELQAQLDLGRFEWSLWDERVGQPETAKEVIRRFEVRYWQSRSRDTTREKTWSKEYEAVFRALDWEKPLTEEVILAAILKTESDTRTRVRFCVALGALARFAGLSVDLEPYRGSYGPKSVNPREVPTQEQVVAAWEQVRRRSRSYGWCVGMMAAYGLRPHECMRLDTTELEAGRPMIRVLAGKTGQRQVWPYPRAFVELFQLRDVTLPRLSMTRTNAEMGHQIVMHLRQRLKLPFQVYDLRHFNAVARLQAGQSLALAAREMGHSVAIHTSRYHAFITEQVHQAEFERLQ